jgi:acyl carrier protein
MGLDAVELVMAVEDHFGISIQDSELEHVRCVSDLVELIQSRIEAAHAAACPTLSSFLRLRSCVREITHDDQFRIRTDTQIIAALTLVERQQLWKRLGELLGSNPPGLRRPPAMRNFLLLLVLVAVVLAVASAAIIDFAVLPLTLALAAIITIIVHCLTVRYRVVPPDGLATFGAITQRIVGVTVATKQLHLRSPDEILDELKPIVAYQLNVQPAQIVPDARFIEDLGMS